MFRIRILASALLCLRLYTPPPVADIGGRRYRVEWHKEDTPVYYIEFPIEYELLHGTSMTENERRLVADIQAWKGVVRESTR